jgi:alpha-2-macroglobulin
MKGTNSGQVTFSGIPDFDLEKHLDYLIRYPYGCLEQTVSSVFPQLYLSDLTDLSQDRQKQTDRNIRAGINKIAKMTLSDGSFTYWPGQVYYNIWSTSYAGHFLALAASKGYLLPSGLMEKWTEFQYRAAGEYKSNYPGRESWLDVSQAYRLYTLALSQKPNMSAMNRMREAGNLSASTAWILAAAYIYAGKPEVAEELIAGRMVGVTDKYSYSGYTYGSELRDMAFTLEVLTMLKRDAEAFTLVEDITKELQDDYYSTQTTAFTLYALSRYVGKDAGKGLSFEFDAPENARETVSAKKAVYMYEMDEKTSKGTILVKNNKSDARLFVNVTLKGQPLQGLETEKSENLQVNITYKDEAGNLLDISSLKQGTDFIAEVSVYHPGTLFPYTDLALSQVFPSGWEIINTRVQDVNSGLKEDVFEYRDYRDDRVYTFFDLRQYEKKTFRVRLNAAYAGRYYLPAVNCEAMYENNVHANSKGRWVEVVR